jgi:hypothetical protein
VCELSCLFGEVWDGGIGPKIGSSRPIISYVQYLWRSRAEIDLIREFYLEKIMLRCHEQGLTGGTRQEINITNRRIP